MKTIFLFIAICFAHLGFGQSVSERPTVLSAKMVRAYELKAESKVEEFYNYLKLLADPKINTEMKAHTSAEALKLFQNKNTLVDNILDKSIKNITLKEFLEQVSKQKNAEFKMSGFSALPQEQAEVRQEWTLNYTLSVPGKKTYSISQKFFIQLEDKKFGSTTKKVWNTYLGDITVVK